MLSEHEQAEIDKEIKKFPARKNACLDALLVVQKSRSYISDEALHAVADYLGMSATELDGIATFYNLIYRKPVGKSVIRLCDSVSCFIMGYEAIKHGIKERLGIDWGETTADKQYTLLPAQCLGICHKAPALMINDVLYTNVDLNNLSEIIRPLDKSGPDHDQTTNGSHAKGWASSQPKRILVGGGL